MTWKGERVLPLLEPVRVYSTKYGLIWLRTVAGHGIRKKFALWWPPRCCRRRLRGLLRWQATLASGWHLAPKPENKYPAICKQKSPDSPPSCELVTFGTPVNLSLNLGVRFVIGSTHQESRAISVNWKHSYKAGIEFEIRFLLPDFHLLWGSGTHPSGLSTFSSFLHWKQQLVVWISVALRQSFLYLTFVLSSWGLREKTCNTLPSFTFNTAPLAAAWWVLTTLLASAWCLSLVSVPRITSQMLLTLAALLASVTDTRTVTVNTNSLILAGRVVSSLRSFYRLSGLCRGSQFLLN